MKIASKGLRIEHVRAASPLKSLLALALAVGAAFCAVTPALAAPILGQNLASFAVLGSSGVTNVPNSIIGGNLGTAPNASAGGGYIFTSGSMHANTGLAQQAQLELDAATVMINGMGPGLTMGPDLTGTINPGIYTVSAGGTNLSGDLILDGGGSNSAVWVFVFPSTLITSSTSNVFVTNVGDGANVGIYWSVASAATLNGDTFAGNVLSYGLISSDGNLDMSCGRLLSATSQVTLNQDTVSLGCAGFESSGGFDQGANIGSGADIVSAIPEPGSLALLGLGLLAFGASRRRKQ